MAQFAARYAVCVGSVAATPGTLAATILLSKLATQHVRRNDARIRSVDVPLESKRVGRFLYTLHSDRPMQAVERLETVWIASANESMAGIVYRGDKQIAHPTQWSFPQWTPSGQRRR